MSARASVGDWSRRQYLTAASTSAVLGSVGLAGCLGGARDENTIVMSGDTDFEGAMDGEDAETSIQEALWDAGLDESITVDVQASVDDTDQRMQNYQSTLQAGRSPPDIFMMDSGWTLPFILREQTTSMTEVLPDDVLSRVENDYLEASLETARHPVTGDLHAIPLFPDFGLMQYRRDLVEDAGYDTSEWDTDPPTWQEFAEAAADARDEAGIEYGFTTQAAAYEGLACCTFNEVMTTWGGAYFGGTETLFEAGDRPITVDSEPVLESVRMMRSFIFGDDASDTLDGYPQIAPSTIVQWTEEESLGPFASGESVMHRNWPFSIMDLGAEDEFGEDLGVMAMPYAISPEEAEFEGTGGSANALGGWHLTLNPNTDRTEMAVEVLEAFTQEEVMLTIFELLGYIPPEVELVADADPDEVGPVARYGEQIQQAADNAIPRPVTDIWPEQASVIAQEINAAYRGAKTPEAALGDLSDRLERSEVDVEGQNGN
ncbi:ABC transporter substrate-binding protein [Natronolimnobius baerhuensis]|uniref:ABC transporter substrate-binding protein n=1 Tax=Natronolimnobius baerhuensis TaxID=253108 RepID=A0A202EDL0_9EURY|nr:ABC transporter substrate-binding protein [Natronolimnobius baerhuensis]